MLKSLILGNFKRHKSTRIDAAPLTVFIGPNNSGKSSVSQALVLLSESLMGSHGQGFLTNPVPRQDTSPDQPFLHGADQRIDLGSFNDVVHQGEQDVTFHIEGALHNPHINDRSQRVSLDLAFRANRVSYHKGEILLDSAAGENSPRLKWTWSQAPGPPTTITLSTNGLVHNFTVGAYPSVLQYAGTTMNRPASPAESADLYTFANAISQLPASFLLSFHPAYPLRGLEESGYPVTLGPENSVDRTMLADRTLALLSVLAYRSDVLERVSTWLENLVGLRVKTRLVPPRRVTIVCEPVNIDSRKDGLFSNEGTGASQLPFILAPIALCPKGETVMISEPEAHLHPKAQSQLASLLLTVAKRKEQQLIIETHSEHVLHVFLSAIAKGEFNKRDLALYYFEPQGRSVNARPLTVDDMGRVEGGLPGFFDQSLGELSDYLDALQKKS